MFWNVCLESKARQPPSWLNFQENQVITVVILLQTIFVLFSFLGCTSKQVIHTIPPPPSEYEKKDYPQKFDQKGLASWYGPNFHGKKTANGERYNMYSLTAAHRFLPFNSQILVTNLENKKQIVVRINDRGPFVKDRIIDLSYAAAKKLDMINSGIVPVEIKTSQPVNPNNRYFIQIGSFISRNKAETLVNKLHQTGYTESRVQKKIIGNQPFWRVQAGIFQTIQTAKKHLPRFKKYNPGCFIIEN